MDGAKRAPSSLVQLTTSSGVIVLMPWSSSVRTTSRAASTPKTPSKRPPKGWVSRWLPMPTGARSMSSPPRRANISPISSMLMLRPASAHQPAKRSRPTLSSSLSVRRWLPPLAVAPIFAISMMLSHRRAPSTRMFSVIGVLLQSMSWKLPSVMSKAVGSGVFAWRLWQSASLIRPPIPGRLPVPAVRAGCAASVRLAAHRRAH